jgi:dTDP-4-amino-4,6-dideoxygalactose transaminase
MIARHRENAAYYQEALRAVAGIRVASVTAGAEPAYWLFTIFAKRRDDLQRKLRGHGIQTSRVHARNDLHDCVRHLRELLPNLDQVEQDMLCIPVGWWVSDEDRQYIAELICEGW